jgi:hypothetical protein
VPLRVHRMDFFKPLMFAPRRGIQACPASVRRWLNREGFTSSTEQGPCQWHTSSCHHCHDHRGGGTASGIAPTRSRVSLSQSLGPGASVAFNAASPTQTSELRPQLPVAQQEATSFFSIIAAVPAELPDPESTRNAVGVIDSDSEF